MCYLVFSVGLATVLPLVQSRHFNIMLLNVSHGQLGANRDSKSNKSIHSLDEFVNEDFRTINDVVRTGDSRCAA